MRDAELPCYQNWFCLSTSLSTSKRTHIT